MHCLLPFVVGALALPVAAAGQSATPAPPVFPVDLRLVHLTVTARDAAGHLVSDLEASDFVVREDGRPQTLQLFARAVEAGQEEALALNLGLLMDTSESMIRVLKLSQEAAVRFLEAIPRARDLVTIFFDQDIRISHYDSEQQQGLIQRIFDLRGGGNTALYDAITVYLSRIEDSPGRKVLVIFTDGEDSTSTVTLGELHRLVRSSPVTIYPIALTPTLSPGSSRELAAKAILLGLAEMTGGQLYHPMTSKDLPGVYARILDELSAQYVLGFASDNTRRDGKLRKLKVEIKRKGMKVRHRAGYYAPLAVPGG